jgi:hypothetical protein
MQLLFLLQQLLPGLLVHDSQRCMVPSALLLQLQPHIRREHLRTRRTVVTLQVLGGHVL